MSYFLFFLAIIVLILVHEFGHFSVAKLFGIRVDEFSVFFPPKLFSKKWGETTYAIGALPFGGYVKIFGENTDESDPALARNSRSFIGKPRIIQAAVIVAGVFFNILLAWLMLSTGYMIGMQTSVDHNGIGTVTDAKVTILGVVPGSPADKAGIKPNDTIVMLQTGTASLDTRTLNTNQQADAVQKFIVAHQDESEVVTVLRDGEQKEFLAKPAAGFVEGHKALGIQLDDVGILKLSPPLALWEGAILTKSMTVETVTGLGSFFSSIVHRSADFNTVAGPIGITVIGSSAVKQGAVATLILMSLISINLAIINLLPIPGLDGGRLLFIIIEGITRRAISEKVAFRLTMVCLALLVTLMLIVSYHDVLRLVHPAA